MRANNRDEAVQNIMKVAKRIAIAILISLPVCILFGYFTRTVITSNFLQIVCFITIMGVAVLIEEIISRRKEKKKQAQEILNIKKDVFK